MIYHSTTLLFSVIHFLLLLSEWKIFIISFRVIYAVIVEVQRQIGNVPTAALLQQHLIPDILRFVKTVERCKHNVKNAAKLNQSALANLVPMSSQTARNKD